MKPVLLTLLAFLILGAGPSASAAQDRPVAGGYSERAANDPGVAAAAAFAVRERGRPAAGREVKVYLVALDDNGKRGRRVGCNDSLVPVTRTVALKADPLKAAVEELLSIPREYEGGLGNYWYGENLRVQSAAIRAGVATIRIRGNVYVAGVCDGPRIEGQIRETARQFRGVRSVRVFINGRPLADAIR